MFDDTLNVDVHTPPFKRRIILHVAICSDEAVALNQVFKDECVRTVFFTPMLEQAFMDGAGLHAAVHADGTGLNSVGVWAVRCHFA